MPSSQANGSANAGVRWQQAAISTAAEMFAPRVISIAHFPFYLLVVQIRLLSQAFGMVAGQRFTALRRQPDRGIGGAKAVIVPALDDLEEEALIEGVGVDLEEFAVAFAVVEDLVVAQRRHGRGVEAEFGFDVVVVIVGNIAGNPRRARAWRRRRRRYRRSANATCCTPEPKNPG